MKSISFAFIAIGVLATFLATPTVMVQSTPTSDPDDLVEALLNPQSSKLKEIPDNIVLKQITDYVRTGTPYILVIILNNKIVFVRNSVIVLARLKQDKAAVEKLDKSLNIVVQKYKPGGAEQAVFIIKQLHQLSTLGLNHLILFTREDLNAEAVIAGAFEAFGGIGNPFGAILNGLLNAASGLLGSVGNMLSGLLGPNGLLGGLLGGIFGGNLLGALLGGAGGFNIGFGHLR